MLNPKITDITGNKYGKLTVIKYAEKRLNNIYWLCKCDCGKEIIVRGSCLRSGHTQSCGCLRSETLTKHKAIGTRLYGAWKHLKSRCHNPNNKRYDCYGGRGIKVCEKWENDFIAFRDWAINNGFKEGLSLDRINVNGDYEPSNCRWATTEQQANNKRTNHYLTYNGKTHTLSEWAKKTGISYTTLRARIRYGWSVEKALTCDVRQLNRGAV